MNSSTELPTILTCVDGFNFINFTHYTTIPAAVIILVLAFLERRKQKRDTCNGRPALVVPLHLLDGYENRAAYAVAFGAVTNDIINLFIESRSAYPFDYPLWAVALILQVQAIEVAVTCFPLFACIATRHKLIGSVCGFLYSSLLFCGVLTKTVQEYCTTDSFKYLQATAIIRIIPVGLCYLYLILRSAGELIKVMLWKIYTLEEDTDHVRPHQIQHVRLLLNGYYDKVTLKEDSIWDKVSYSSIKGFKYPVKIVSAVFIIVVVLYQLLTVEIFTGAELTDVVSQIPSETFENEFTIFNMTFVFLSPQAVRGMLAVYHTSVAISCMLGVLHIYFFMKVYRKNILRLYRGDRSFMMDNIPKSHYLMASSLRFPGYQIAYSLWGTVIMFITLLLVGLLVCYTMFFMAANDFLLSFVSTIAQLLSFPVTTLLLFWIQVLLAKYVLMQDRIHKTDEYPPVNVDNRRFYEDFNFFTLFGSLAIGIFSCLVRILIGTVMGVLMVGRLDKTTFMRDTETYDKGHLCYISMLQIDNAHNHPVLRVFCGILWDRALERRNSKTFLLGSSRRQRKYRTFPSVEPPSEENTLNNATLGTSRQSSVSINVKTARKWKLAYTLLWNPSLRKLRKQELSSHLELSRKTNSTEKTHEQELETVHVWNTNRGSPVNTNVQIS